MRCVRERRLALDSDVVLVGVGLHRLQASEYVGRQHAMDVVGGEDACKQVGLLTTGVIEGAVAVRAGPGGTFAGAAMSDEQERPGRVRVARVLRRDAPVTVRGQEVLG